MLGKNRNSAGIKDILNNFDTLAQSKSTGENHSGYPDIEKARQAVQIQLVRDDHGNPYSLWCDIGQFRKYGPGVFLSFFFLKYLLIVMGFLLVFPLANMIILIVENDHFIATNMEIALEATTISSLHMSQNVIVGFNFTVLLVLTVSIIVWKSIQMEEVLKCTQIVCLPSYFTAILTNIPNYYSQKDIKAYLEVHYGEVHEIYTPKNYNQDLTHFKYCLRTINQFKQERQLYHRSKHTSSCLPLVEKFFSFKEQHEQLSKKVVQDKYYSPYCAFVTFRSVVSRQRLLEDQDISLGQCWKKGSGTRSLDQSRLYKEQKLEFKECKMEPDGIVWQNLNLSDREKFIRCGIIAFLLSIFLSVSIIIFGIMAGAESSLYEDQFGHLTEQDIIDTNNEEMLQAFCIELSFINFAKYPQCQPYHGTFLAYTFLYVSFPVVIVLLKMAFSVLINKLVILRRHRYEVHRIHWKITLTTLFYTLTSAAIKWFIYQTIQVGPAHFELLSIFVPILNHIAKIIPIQPSQIHLYHDVSKKWAGHTSHKIILIGIFVFNFVIILHHLTHLFHQKCKKSKAEKEETQQRMEEHLRGDHFSIEYVYSQTLTIFLFSMIYFSCMPIIYLLSFVSLLLLYWTVKYKFIRIDRRPPLYAHSISQLSTKIVCIGLAINSLVSPLYFGDQDNPHESWLERYKTHWYYTINLVVILLFLFWKDPTARLLCLAKNKVQECLLRGNSCKEDYNNRLHSMKAGKAGLQSYSMHNNHQYAQLLKVLYVINHKQMNHFAYFKHQEIQNIRMAAIRQKKIVLFTQIYQSLKAELKEIEGSPALAGVIDSDQEKCRMYLERLNEIQKEAVLQLEEEQSFLELQKSIKSKMKELTTIKSNISSENKSVLQTHEQIDAILDHEAIVDGRGRNSS